MSKINLEQMSDALFLTQEERKEIQMIIERKRNVALEKLLNVHDTVVSAAFGDAIKTSAQYLNAVKDAMSKATDYINEDRMEEVVITPADEFNVGKTETVAHSVAVMYNKYNGVPERMSNMQKTLFDTSEELITYFMLHKKYSTAENQEAIEDITKFSYADVSNNKKRKKS
jgi:membrane glycosyltransferase